jgi:hypothetical protein
MPLARLSGDEFAVAIRHLQADSDVQKAITTSAPRSRRPISSGIATSS